MGNNGLTRDEEGAVVVEARYAVGKGLLLGSGTHWLLLTDPDDELVVQELWQALAGSASDHLDVAERVLSVVAKAFGGDPPGLAMVDLAPGAASAISRGTGHVRLAGPARILTLDQGADPEDVVTPRRLVGGVVNASAVQLRPAAHEVAPASGLIDGIPAEILAARGPEGPPPPRPRRSHAGLDAEDTGSLLDTTEPDPAMVERIEEGGHTTIRPARTTSPEPPAASESRVDAVAPTQDDHDGATTHRPAHLAQGTSPTVMAISCPLGHLTPAASASCRVCHQRPAPQEPRRVQRPVLGGLRLPTGEVVPLDRGVVLGRKPAPLEGSQDWPHLVHLPPGHSYVSRLHLQIELDGWDVVARDLDSRGGSTITLPGRDPVRMRPGDGYVLEPGTVVDLAEVYAVRYETGPVASR